MYLWRFEQILVSVMPEVEGPDDFALPYWNYARSTRAACLPPAFREPKLPGGVEDNPLFVDPRDQAGRMNGGLPLSPEVVSADRAFRAPRFEAAARLGFGGGEPARAHFGGSSGQLERTPHNDIHNQVGGLMLDPRTAALDPIFWLHHANIDRLWVQWRSAPRNGDHPSTQFWKDEAFEFHDSAGTLAPPIKVHQVEQTDALLGYRYDDQVEAIVDSDASDREFEPEAIEPPQLAGASEQGLELRGGRASVRVTVPMETRDAVERTVETQRVVSVRVEYVEAEANPETVYGVYLQGPEGDPVHVGNLSLFGIELWNDLNRDEHGGNGFQFEYDVTQEVEDLAARGQWSTDAIDVIFEPLGEEPAALADQAERTIEPVRIGRVSLFVG
jgi:tyrosinase